MSNLSQDGIRLLHLKYTSRNLFGKSLNSIKISQQTLGPKIRTQFQAKLPLFLTHIWQSYFLRFYARSEVWTFFFLCCQLFLEGGLFLKISAVLWAGWSQSSGPNWAPLHMQCDDVDLASMTLTGSMHSLTHSYLWAHALYALVYSEKWPTGPTKSFRTWTGIWGVPLRGIPLKMIFRPLLKSWWISGLSL